MILDFWFSLFMQVLTYIVTLFPLADSSLVSTLNTNFTNIITALNQGSVLLPLDTLAVFITIILTTELILMTVRLGINILQRLHIFG